MPEKRLNNSVETPKGKERAMNNTLEETLMDGMDSARYAGELLGEKLESWVHDNHMLGKLEKFTDRGASTYTLSNPERLWAELTLSTGFSDKRSGIIEVRAQLVFDRDKGGISAFDFSPVYSYVDRVYPEFNESYYRNVYDSIITTYLSTKKAKGGSLEETIRRFEEGWGKGLGIKGDLTDTYANAVLLESARAMVDGVRVHDIPFIGLGVVERDHVTLRFLGDMVGKVAIGEGSSVKDMNLLLSLGFKGGSVFDEKRVTTRSVHHRKRNGWFDAGAPLDSTVREEVRNMVEPVADKARGGGSSTVVDDLMFTGGDETTAGDPSAIEGIGGKAVRWGCLRFERFIGEYLSEHITSLDECSRRIDYGTDIVTYTLGDSGRWGRLTFVLSSGCSVYGIDRDRSTVITMRAIIEDTRGDEEVGYAGTISGSAYYKVPVDLDLDSQHLLGALDFTSVEDGYFKPFLEILLGTNHSKDREFGKAPSGVWVIDDEFGGDDDLQDKTDNRRLATQYAQQAKFALIEMAERQGFEYISDVSDERLDPFIERELEVDDRLRVRVSRILEALTDDEVSPIVSMEVDGRSLFFDYGDERGVGVPLSEFFNDGRPHLEPMFEKAWEEVRD